MPRVLLILLLAVPAAAQITESIEVHVLEIEATVLDRGGKPVEGLAAADFDVKVDGKLVPVTNFFMVKRGVVRASGAPPPEGAPEARTTPPPEEVIPTRLVLFIDDAHLHQRGKKRALDSLRTFIEQTMDNATTAMLVRWNGSSATVIVPATKDRAQLLAALGKMANEPALVRHAESYRGVMDDLKRANLDSDLMFQHVVAYCENQMRETRQTIDALQTVTRIAAGLEGRKVLLHVSEGLPLFAGWEVLATIGMENSLEMMRFELSQQYRALTKFAQESGVIFCPFDPSGPDGARYSVDVPGGNPRPELTRENNRNTAVLMARETGGQLIADTNELDLALSRVTEQVTTYYSLGVSAPKNGRGPFDIRVSLRNRPELRVVTAPRRSVKSRSEMIANGVRSRLYLREATNPLDARLHVGVPTREGTRCAVTVGAIVNTKNLTLIPIDDAVRGEISFHFAVLDDRQQESQVRSTTKEIWPRPGANVTESVSVGLGPRKYVISTALVDDVSGEASYMQDEIDATVCAH